MALTQDSVLSVLINEGGKMKNSEMLSLFKTHLNCNDPAEKKQNRELFKTFVNNIAVVKEIEDTRYIVLKKKYQHLLEPQSDQRAQKDDTGDVDDQPAGENIPKTTQSESGTAPAVRSELPTQHPETHSTEEPEPSFITTALQRHNSMNVKARKAMQFKVSHKINTEEVQAPQLGISSSDKTETGKYKPIALPLRVPVVTTSPPEIKNEEIENSKHKPVALPLRVPIVITSPPDENSNKVHLVPVNSMSGPQISPRLKRRSHTDNAAIVDTLQLRRPADEPRYGEIVPLDTAEHEWMVTSAAGRWALVYGYLLNDAHLAEKRDFISGFTALHWAAKAGNSDMVCKLIDISRQNNRGLDINTKSFAGYTPLHIAAMYHQEYIIGILVKEYGANCHIRDNSGKKAHHYLHNGISSVIRELLGDPKVVHPEQKKNTDTDGDSQKYSHSISRLFQPQTVGYKKKPKQRNTFLSIAEDSKDTRDEHGTVVHKVRSDVFN